MAIYSNRTLARMFRDLSDCLTAEHRRNLARRLLHPRQSLPAEWEVIVLWGLRRQGRIEYEPTLGGKSKGDVLFQSRTDPSFSFHADITAVSDAGYEKENPLEHFQDEVYRFLGRGTVLPGSLNIHVRGKTLGGHGDARMTLAIPSKAKMPTWLSENLSELARNIRKDPTRSHQFSGLCCGELVLITFEPKGPSGIATCHPCYTTTYSLRRNPVINRLQEKAHQLSSTGYRGLKLVILCDGGSALLSERGRPSPGSYDLQMILAEFAKSDSTVDAVVVLAPEVPHGSMHPTGMSAHLHILRTLSGPTSDLLLILLNAMCLDWPPPVDTARNAANLLRTSSLFRSSFLGGFVMNGEEIRVSARVFVGLMAGKLGKAEQLQKPVTAQVAAFLEQGRRLVETRIEHCPEEDDDWVVMRFGDPDPAWGLKFLEPGE